LSGIPYSQNLDLGVGFLVKYIKVSNDFYPKVNIICQFSYLWKFTDNFNGIFKKLGKFYAVNIGFISALPIL